MKKLTDIQVVEVCQRYISGEASTTLAKHFNVSPVAIRGLLKRRNIERRGQVAAQRKYTHNEAFFSSIENEEQAYWLGFIAADGYISSSNNSSNAALVVSLAMKDIEHLYRLQKALQSNHPIKEYIYSKVQFARLFIRSKQLTDDLASYGIVAAKTFTFNWPILPEKLLVPFLRGYVDGDGGFYINSNKKDFKRANYTNHIFSVTSNKLFIEACQQFLMEKCALLQTKLDQRHTNIPIFTLRYSGRQQCLRIGKLLYEGATIYLPRKRNCVLSFDNAAKNIRQNHLASRGTSAGSRLFVNAPIVEL